MCDKLLINYLFFQAAASGLETPSRVMPPRGVAVRAPPTPLFKRSSRATAASCSGSKRKQVAPTKKASQSQVKCCFKSALLTCNDSFVEVSMVLLFVNIFLIFRWDRELLC